jgi:hypothetical protein
MSGTPGASEWLTTPQGKAELSALTHLSGVELDEEVFDVLVELTRLGVVPTAVNQVLKSLASVAAKQPPRQ